RRVLHAARLHDRREPGGAVRAEADRRAAASDRAARGAAGRRRRGHRPAHGRRRHRHGLLARRPALFRSAPLRARHARADQPPRDQPRRGLHRGHGLHRGRPAADAAAQRAAAARAAAREPLQDRDQEVGVSPVSDLDPTPADRFSFGLWTVGNTGRDMWGDATRPVADPCRLVAKLGEIGAWGVNLHDNDLVPLGASASERDRIVSGFKAACADAGVVVPMATTNLFSHSVFKDGAFTANDPAVRAFALRKTMDAIDLGVELGARLYVFWGGREGVEADACRDPLSAIARMRDALDFLCGYVRDRRYELRFALEAKPNEPRGDLYFPTTGHMLHLISTLAPEHQPMVGVNPEVAHETMSGLSMVHAVAQALDAGKLFHID